MNSGIYQITNQSNGNRYIGSAVNLQARWAVHLSTLRRGYHHNPHLQAAFDKYGEIAFAFGILECVVVESLIRREQYYLDTLNPEYNILRTAGSRLGHYVSLQTRKKIGDANRRRRVTKETRHKISKAMTGKRNHFLGRHHSEETKRKIGKAGKGRHPFNYGKHLSEEHCRKISETLTGRQPSKETRLKMSEAQKARQRRVRAARQAAQLAVETLPRIE